MLNLIHQLIESERVYREVLKSIEDQAPQLFRQARKELGLTQRQLADQLGCDFSYISKIENGHLKPGKPTLLKLVELIEKG